MERKRTIEDARYYVSPSPWEDVRRVLLLVVLTVVTVLMAIALDEWISYILAAAVELLWVFLVSRWKDNERRIDDENTQVLYGPEGKELLDDFVTGELYYDKLAYSWSEVPLRLSHRADHQIQRYSGRLSANL